MSRLETFNTIVIGGWLILHRPTHPEGADLVSIGRCGEGCALYREADKGVNQVLR